ncbi:Gfo/Idh/MocA family oxidoreductase [Paenibacillus lutrae]|uniref:Oxidoreductase n=1 Tax=Paenibacillus lutrae TaxID=2078573 RepID=A0A7X3K1D6_9BACL|nr:oxidoreductase [Paenibacillus lutrae]
MNVLIIGLGYAGTRFQQAFQHLNKKNAYAHPVELAYVNRSPRRAAIKSFRTVEAALAEFKPAIVVVSVSDGSHIEVLNSLEGYEGFIICEKPLTKPSDDLEQLQTRLKRTSGFCLDLVERYSDATVALKNYVAKNNLRLIRANFYWGKDRIHDHRPTTGVISEIIHPLDLVQWIADPDSALELEQVQGVRSDFSISGPDVLDSAAIIASLNGAAVTGYSSFVTIIRKREVEFVFASPDNKLIYATAVYDTPVWDKDQLKVWQKTSSGEQVILDLTTEVDETEAELSTIRKLVRLVEDVTGYAASGSEPSQPFANLETSIKLQKLLNAVDRNARTIGPMQYVVGSERESYYDETNLERLG